MKFPILKTNICHYSDQYRHFLLLFFFYNKQMNCIGFIHFFIKQNFKINFCDKFRVSFNYLFGFQFLRTPYLLNIISKEDFWYIRFSFEWFRISVEVHVRIISQLESFLFIFGVVVFLCLFVWGLLLSCFCVCCCFVVAVVFCFVFVTVVLLPFLWISQLLSLIKQTGI